MTLDDIHDVWRFRHLNRDTADVVDCGDNYGIVICRDPIETSGIRIFLVAPHATTGKPVIKAHNHVSVGQAYALVQALKHKIDLIQGTS